MFLALIIFVVCILAWAWIGYPLFLALVARPVSRVPRDNMTTGSGDADDSPSRFGLARADDSPSRFGLARGDDSPSSFGVARPPVSILIAAYNEESVIAARLQNLTETDLPPGTEILLGCDGCDDRTVEIAKEWEKTLPELTVLDFNPRRGKPAVLLDLVAKARHQFLVFSDANTMFKKDTVTKLLEPLLADETVRTSGSELECHHRGSPGGANVDKEGNRNFPFFKTSHHCRKDSGGVNHFPDGLSPNETIGGTCGRLVFTVPNGGETQENAYWKLETWMKIHESRLDSCLGANGAAYAIRKSLFWDELPNKTIIDDFVIGMKVRESGAKMLYVTEAMATEETPVKISDEWHRRVRIGMGGYQALGLCRGCLHPRFGFFALAFFSHKVLRWFTPHLMILLAFCTLLGVGISGGWFLWTVFFAQAAFYSAALIGGRVVRETGGRVVPASQTEPGGRVVPASQWHRIMRIPQLCHYFTAMQLALFAGFLRWCRGIQGGTWKRTER